MDVFITSAVNIDNLHKAFRQDQRTVNVLRGVSLSVSKGVIQGIIGRSGAGKSTLVRCLNGLEPYDAGRIEIQGQPLSPTTQKRIGNIFQNFNLLSRRTVLENVALPLELAGWAAPRIKSKCEETLKLVGLRDFLQAYPSQLSGGQRQRVAIARAIVADVDLLLCDEFPSALDPEISLDILALLRELNQRLGLTIILITHDMSVVREICDQVCVLDQGTIVEAGDVGSILLKPQHMVTQSLVQGLFIKDLPQALKSHLSNQPILGGHTVIRLVFSGESAQQPVIASVIEAYHVPVNIIAANMDHIREVAFGCLLVTIPYNEETLPKIHRHLIRNNVAAEIVGYLP